MSDVITFLNALRSSANQAAAAVVAATNASARTGGSSGAEGRGSGGGSGSGSGRTGGNPSPGDRGHSAEVIDALRRLSGRT